MHFDYIKSQRHLILMENAKQINNTVFARHWHHLLVKTYVVTNRSKNETRLCRYTHTHPFNGPLSGTTRVSRYQKSKTNLDFTEAGDSEWQWHQLGHMQVCTLFQTDNHASTPPLSFLQAGCPSCHPANSVKALKALCRYNIMLLCKQVKQ